MSKLLTSIKQFLCEYAGTRESSTLEEIYLGNASSLQELERRQKEIDRGEAPFQTKWYV